MGPFWVRLELSRREEFEDGAFNVWNLEDEIDRVLKGTRYQLDRFSVGVEGGPTFESVRD